MLCVCVVKDVFEMKYAHTPMETSSTPAATARATDVTSKQPSADVSKSTLSALSAARKDVTGDGDESEEEREKRLHELQEQVASTDVYNILGMMRNGADESGEVRTCGS